MKLSSIDKKIKEDNYFINCYRLLIRSKMIHFLLLLIEILLILLQEIDIFHRGFKPIYKIEGDIIISPIMLLIKIFNRFPEYVNFLITVLSMIIFDAIYLLLCKKKKKKKNMFHKIIINFLEFFFLEYMLYFFIVYYSYYQDYFF